jgi:hypothetical protein
MLHESEYTHAYMQYVKISLYVYMYVMIHHSSDLSCNSGLVVKAPTYARYASTSSV